MSIYTLEIGNDLFIKGTTMNRNVGFIIVGVIVFVAILIGARSFVAADSLPENESCNSGLISDDTEFVEIDESVATENLLMQKKLWNQNKYRSNTRCCR